MQTIESIVTEAKARFHQLSEEWPTDDSLPAIDSHHKLLVHDAFQNMAMRMNYSLQDSGLMNSHIDEELLFRAPLWPTNEYDATVVRNALTAAVQPFCDRILSTPQHVRIACLGPRQAFAAAKVLHDLRRGIDFFANRHQGNADGTLDCIYTGDLDALTAHLEQFHVPGMQILRDGADDRGRQARENATSFIKHVRALCVMKTYGWRPETAYCWQISRCALRMFGKDDCSQWEEVLSFVGESRVSAASLMLGGEMKELAEIVFEARPRRWSRLRSAWITVCIQSCI